MIPILSKPETDLLLLCATDRAFLYGNVSLQMVSMSARFPAFAKNVMRLRESPAVTARHYSMELVTPELMGRAILETLGADALPVVFCWSPKSRDQRRLCVLVPDGQTVQLAQPRPHGYESVPVQILEASAVADAQFLQPAEDPPQNTARAPYRRRSAQAATSPKGRRSPGEKKPGAKPGEKAA